VTGEMTEELILSGADIIKVGIGPGSVCTTRKVIRFRSCARRQHAAARPTRDVTSCFCVYSQETGVGYPQLSAVMECADAAHGLGGHIISDGGCSCTGDIAKAFGGGSDFVMLGGMFSGYDESGGEVVVKDDGKKVKLFYGMSSTTAMKKHANGVAEYRASEGKTVEVPYKVPVTSLVLDILGGLRSCCTYVGAARLKELSRRTTFIRCTQQLNPIFAANVEYKPEPRTGEKRKEC